MYQIAYRTVVVLPRMVSRSPVRRERAECVEFWRLTVTTIESFSTLSVDVGGCRRRIGSPVESRGGER